MTEQIADSNTADKKPDAPVNRLWAFTPLDLIKVMAGVAALAGLTFHLVGTVWNETYLATWGVDAALFPKSTDWLVIHGFEQLLAVALDLWPQTLANLLWLVLLALGISLYWMSLSWLGQRIDSSEHPSGLRSGRHGCAHWCPGSSLRSRCWSQYPPPFSR